ncbi:MAG: hypothetical protein RJB64_691 [Pseudomonadota bacterium]|jgi:hypothetical protein
MRPTNKVRHLTITLLLGVGALITAQAESAGPVPPVLTKYQQECAACHVAYPPGLLPATSWQRLMGGLSKHYGVDASLEANSLREISGWLKTHAGPFKRGVEEPPQDRITKSAWFMRKHNEHEVAPAVWKRTAVGSPANCAACHSNAAQGNFNERDIRIPK